MLSMMTRERKGSLAIVQHFPLPGILPEGQMLALQRDLGILALISHESEGVRMLASIRFTPSELTVLSPLLDSYPDYAPYELLYAHFYGQAERVTQADIEQSRAMIHKASEQGAAHVEILMRPMRNVISRARLKLHVLGIDVVSMLETGYLLRKPPGRRRRRVGQDRGKEGTR